MCTYNSGLLTVTVVVKLFGAHQVDLSEDVLRDDLPVTAEFTYSVKWRETDTPYEKRMDKYRRYSFLPQHLEVGRWSSRHT